jgi:protein-tyrosine phosphatase
VTVRSTTVSTLGHKVKQTLWRVEAQLSRPPSEGTAPGRAADYGILIVCLGNYCRSPVAEGILRVKLAELGLGDAVRVESAGTSTYYRGRRPHKHARRESLRRGVDIGGHRARGLDDLDLAAYDLVVAVDERTRDELSAVDPARLVLLGSFGEGGDIADPNGREPRVFAETHDAIEAACVSLARFVADRLSSTSEKTAQ